MTSSWITLLTFSSVTLLVISVGMLAYDWIFRYRFAVNDRLRELSAPATPTRRSRCSRTSPACGVRSSSKRVPGVNGC